MGCSPSIAQQKQTVEQNKASPREPGKTLLTRQAPDIYKRKTHRKLGNLLSFDDFHLGDKCLHYYFMKEQFEGFLLDEVEVSMRASELHGKLELVTLTAVPEAFMVKGPFGGEARVQTFCNDMWPKDLLSAIQQVTVNAEDAGEASSGDEFEA